MSSILRALAIAASTTAVLLACAACTGDAARSGAHSPATATPSASSSSLASSPEPSASAPTTAGTEADVVDAVRDYYRTTDALFSDSSSSIDGASQVAGGAELEEVRKLVQQRRLRGERQEGAVTVVSVEPTQEVPGPPATVSADVCIDVSQVDVVNAEGRSVVEPGRPPRSLIHAVVVDRGSAGWLVESTDARGEPCSGS